MLPAQYIELFTKTGTTLRQHIDTNFEGSMTGWAKHVGFKMTRQQTARYIDAGCYLVDGEVWHISKYQMIQKTFFAAMIKPTMP